MVFKNSNNINKKFKFQPIKKAKKKRLSVQAKQVLKEYRLKSLLNNVDDEKLKAFVKSHKEEESPLNGSGGPLPKKVKTLSTANPVPTSEIIHHVIYTEEEKVKYRDAFRKRNAEKMARPNVKLTELGLKASLERDETSRIPLFLSDFQHFMMYAQLQHFSVGNLPTWIKIERKKRSKVDRYMFIIIEGVSLLDFVESENECPTLKSFAIKLDMMTPLSYGGNLTEEVATVPLTRNQRDKVVEKYGSLKEASNDKRVVQVMRTIYPFKDFKSGASKQIAPVKKDPVFPRTELLLTPWQMIEEGYPLPIKEDLEKYKGFVYTKESYSEVSENSPMMGLDVEMCRTTKGMEVTRVSVVDENHAVFYTSFVKPPNRILDYVTKYSGITPDLLRNVTTTLDDVHAYLRKNLPSDVILVGHSLNFDLVALKMFHPYVIDSSVCFNMSGVKHRKSKLRYLVAELLSEKIQEGDDGHDPTEDALGSLKLVQEKLKRNIGWGNALISGVRPAEESLAAHVLLLQKEQQEQPKTKKSKTEINTFSFEHKLKQKSAKSKDASFAALFLGNLFHNLTQKEHKVLLIAKSEETATYRNFIPKEMDVDNPECPFQIKTCETNKAVVKYGKYHAIDEGITLMHIKVADCQKAEKLVKKLLLNINDGDDKHKNILVGVFLAGKHAEGIQPSNNHALFLINMFRNYLPPIEEYIAQLP